MIWFIAFCAFMAGYCVARAHAEHIKRQQDKKFAEKLRLIINRPDFGGWNWTPPKLPPCPYCPPNCTDSGLPQPEPFVEYGEDIFGTHHV